MRSNSEYLILVGVACAILAATPAKSHAAKAPYTTKASVEQSVLLEQDVLPQKTEQSGVQAMFVLWVHTDID